MGIASYRLRGNPWEQGTLAGMPIRPLRDTRALKLCSLGLACVLLSAGVRTRTQQAPADSCFEVLPTSPVEHPQHPPALWFLDRRHGRYNETRFMLRLPREASAEAMRYWERMPHDSLYVHVMGGMWGHRFQLHQVGADFVGRYIHYTDWGYPANYEVTLRRIDCQSRRWDKGGPKMNLRFGT